MTSYPDIHARDSVAEAYMNAIVQAIGGLYEIWILGIGYHGPCGFWILLDGVIRIREAFFLSTFEFHETVIWRSLC